MDTYNISSIDKMEQSNMLNVETHLVIESSFHGFKSTIVQRREKRGFAAIALVNPKNPANIGGVLRASGCYNAAMVVIAGARPIRLAQLATDTAKAWRHLPHVLVEDVFDVIPYNCVPIAVDLLPDAKPLTKYIHPERAFYIFGAEDATLGKAITDKCRDKIYIPTIGCMNLAAAVNVVLYDRLSKQRNG